MLRGALERPIAVTMLFTAAALIGILGYRRLPVDLLPSIVYPRLTVLTTYEDIPARDLERLVTQRLEEVVTAQTGVRSVRSSTREGVSILTVEYEWGTQMDFANLHLREAIDRVAFRDDFPEGAERPVILRWDPTSRPISILVLEGTDRIGELTEFAREVVKPAIEQVDGVSRAEIVGGVEREIRVEPDPRRLAIYGIDVEDVRAALARSNVSFPGGKVRQGPLHLSLRIDGEYENLEEIGKTDILRAGGSPIRVSDVATVLDTTKEREGSTLLGGQPVVSMLIYKEPEANTIRASEAVDDALGAVVADYGDFAYRFVYRDARYVRASFDGLEQSLVTGGVLAVLVLFVFLYDLRSPIVVGLSIPVSLVITMGLLYFADVKLNLMSLGGLSLAAGLLVDNSIVVLENINRHLRRSRPAEPGPEDGPLTTAGLLRRRRIADAAWRGAGEVARPVTAATFTTIAVFFPVVYVPGIAGAFFRDQALSVTLALLVSIAAALLLQPVLSTWLLRAEDRPPRGVFRLFRWAFERFHDVYHSLLIRVLRYPVSALLALVLALAGAGYWAGQVGRSFMPERSSGDLRLDLELAPGTPLEQTEAVVARLAGWIDSRPGVESVFSQIGRTEMTLAAMQDYSASNTARLRVILEPGRSAHRRGRELEQELGERIRELPLEGFSFRDEGVGLGEILGSGGAEFRLGVITDDPLEALRAAEELLPSLRAIPGLTDLKMDRVLGTPNVVARLDREEILRQGLDPDQVASEVRARIAGVEATFFNEIDQRIDIAVRFSRPERIDLAAALASPIRLPGGRDVPLRAFLTLDEERPVRELVRYDQRRLVTISGDVVDRGVDEVWRDAEAVVASANLDPSIRVVETGARREMTRSFRDLGMAMLLAAVLVYMILAAQFESFLDPLLIAAVIPIGLAGSVVAIGVTGGTFNVLSLIGILALLGIAVNDAIVKVDTIRRLREEGTPGYEAILQAGTLRLRPIVMTSATTILAMLPMAIGLGGGEQLQRPLAITIIGGLALTTATTLFFTPLLYRVAHRLQVPTP